MTKKRTLDDSTKTRIKEPFDNIADFIYIKKVLKKVLKCINQDQNSIWYDPMLDHQQEFEQIKKVYQQHQQNLPAGHFTAE